MQLDGEIRESLKVSLPLVFVQVVESIYSLTDTYFVSGLGREALAAVGIASYLTWLIGVFLALLQVPLSILVAQNIGAGKLSEARRTAGGIIATGLVYVLALSLLFYITAEHLVALQSGATGVVYKYAVEYLKARLSGFVAISTSMMLDTIIIATGRTVYSLIANFVGVFANIVLDPLMIYGLYGFPRLEVAGAAYATIIASTAVVPIQLHFLSRLGLMPILVLPSDTISLALKLGWPAFAERVVLAVGNNVYAGVIARLGAAVMAAHNVGLRIESLIYMPGFAFAMTASTLVGQRVGRADYESAKSTGLKVIHIGSAVMAFLGVLAAALSRFIVAPFSPSPEIAELASMYLVIAGLSELGLGFAMTAGGAIRGAGETRLPFLVNAGSLLLIRIALSIALAPILGVIGPWLAMFVDVYARGVVMYLLFRCRFHSFAKKLV